MSVTITMPQMGESVVEGTISRWLVAEGDHVEKDQTVCEITTDKVDAEIPAPEAGVISKILVGADATVEVGTELAVLDPNVSAGASKPAKKTAEPATSAAPAAATVGDSKRVSPLAKRIAEDQGVDVNAVQGSGTAGRVLRADLDGHLKQPAAPVATTPAAAPSAAVSAVPGSVAELLSKFKVPTYRPREGDREIPFSTIRRKVAEHMIVSKIVSPHVGTLAEVDLHGLVKLRESNKSAFKKTHGFNLTYLPFIVQAIVRALKEYPRMNASVVGETIIERNGIHVGVAVETEKGLLVPVIRDADRLSLTGTAQAIEDLASRARNRKITADELQGGTFTVSNPGRQGNLFGFAVINQPQVGIIRMGEVKKRPVVVSQGGEDVIAIHPVMYLSLSYDHRIIDGVTGNSFLYSVGAHLQSAEFEI